MLQILKASAGSGKTFRLTREYIRLLFKAKYANAHRRILAVTFTNKATDEMKSRILLELNKLAKAEKSDYRADLCEEFSCSEQSIDKKAQELLIEILHDYSYFSISTIDRFFQQIIRSFTREIGLSGGYNVELEQKRVAEIAVDNMLASLDKTENKQLLDWLTRFSEDKIEKGESWDFRRNINALSGELAKEEYRLLSKNLAEKLENKDFLANYQAKMYAICQKFESDVTKIAGQALKIIAGCGLLDTDFSGSSRSPMKYWNKILNKDFSEPTKTFYNLQNNIDKWAAKSADAGIKNKIEQSYNDGLNDCVVDICAMFDSQFRSYQTARQIIKNLYTLGILADIERQIKAYLSERNQVLLADSTHLLNMVIDGSDTPFVYEKIGVRLAHFMMDEFQDTSAMQWQNFRPLLKNSLDQHHENLIVGDVKQSIYRWRNSDWTLLDSRLDRDFRPEELQHETLFRNWRSDKNIVDFNNAFFSFASKFLQQQFNDEAETFSANLPENKILQAYSDVYQQLGKQTQDGQVQIEFIEADDENFWKEIALEKLVQKIELLQDKNYRLSDMAILVRSKQDGKAIADFLLQYKQSEKARAGYHYDIISDEALVIAGAASVKFLVGMLRWIVEPNDLINQAVTAFEYGKLIGNQSQEEALKQLFSDEHKENLLNNLWEKHSDKSIEEIKNQSLFEMLEQIIALFRLGDDENETVFVQAFQDIVYDFTSQNVAGPHNFLRWWDDVGCNRTLALSGAQNAIRILTIHKSKGLEFNVLLMPFCDFKIDQKAENIVWCQPKMAPFNELDIVPVTYSGSKNTLFFEEYLNEKQHSYIDNLNLIYVAFTRARHELIVFCPKPKKEGAVNSVAGLLYAFAPPSPPGEGDVSPIRQANTGEKETNNEQTLTSPPSGGLGGATVPRYISSQNKKHLKLKLRSDGFGENENARYKQLDYGILMHDLLSAVYDENDLPFVLQKMQSEGKINEEEKFLMEEKIRHLWKNEEIKKWFSTDYRIMNECVIITPQGSSYRPDRVILGERETIVIDYKFGKERKSYLKQLENYVQLIEKMGFPNVSGFVLYAEEEYFKKV